MGCPAPAGSLPFVTLWVERSWVSSVCQYVSMSGLKWADGCPNPCAAPESLSHFLRTVITRLGAQPPLSCDPVSGLSP